jgi:hypothetical protein
MQGDQARSPGQTERLSPVTSRTSWSESVGRPCLSATSVERKAAWRRQQRQAARELAARACAALQQALQIRARAEQCWELRFCERKRRGVTPLSSGWAASHDGLECLLPGRHE